jgi:hypothetical protein
VKFKNCEISKNLKNLNSETSRRRRRKRRRRRRIFVVPRPGTTSSQQQKKKKYFENCNCIFDVIFLLYCPPF